MKALHSAKLRDWLLRALFIALAAPAAPESHAASSSPQNERAPRIANPAAVYCGQQGGRLRSVRKIVAGKDYGEYAACEFGEHRLCEEWAMFRGACPVGGLDVSGYGGDALVYCAVTGGTVDTQHRTCSFSNGANCGLDELYAGRCRQQTVRTASGIRYWQVPSAGLAIAYLGGAMALIKSSGGIPDARGAVRQRHKPLRLVVDIIRVAELPADGSLGFNRRDAEEERSALDAGSLGSTSMPAVAGSATVVGVGDLRVKTFVTLARFDACSVVFERTARFYHGGAMVTMTLAANADTLIADNPDYLTVDARRCGASPVWRRSGQGNAPERFYADLVAEKVSRSALNWFHSFEPAVRSTAVLESRTR